jgi:hypothetical protein
VKTRGPVSYPYETSGVIIVLSLKIKRKICLKQIFADRKPRLNYKTKQYEKCLRLAIFCVHLTTVALRFS